VKELPDDNAYQDLANAVVAQAVKDYKNLLKRPRLTDRQQFEKEKIEAFFRSDWGEMLTGLDGDFCIKRIKESVVKKKRQKQKAT
jgi:hypothetical protein